MKLQGAETGKAPVRVRYEKGGLLAARDLQADTAYETRMRQMHIRALHQTWGIAFGFNVFISSNETLVSLKMGLAYDCYGREIVQAASQVIPMPRLPETGGAMEDWYFDLVIYYEPALFRGNRDCPGFRETAGCRWVAAGPASDPDGARMALAEGIRLGDEIPVARFLVSENGLSEPILFMRKRAQGLIRPQTAGGRVEKGEIEITGTPGQWSAQIATGAGKFAGTPAYFVKLVDHPLGSHSSFVPYLPSGVRATVLGPFVSIKDPTPSGFTLDVRHAANNGQAYTDNLMLPGGDAAAKLPVAVEWFGVEAALVDAPALEFMPVFVMLNL
jgi:hypothetical protein